jgi:hypothetical protein
MRPKLWPVSDHRVTLLGPDGPNFVESGESSLPANRRGRPKDFYLWFGDPFVVVAIPSKRDFLIPV